MDSKTVLLVDDDMDVLESTQYLLMDEGFDVITARNGQEAISEFIGNKPGIIFMDIKMPIMDGYDAFYKIKKLDKNAKIVFTSSYAIDNEKFQKAKESTLCDLLNKPFDIDSMIEMIKKYVPQLERKVSNP